jgi:hypothetical protein
MAERSRFRRLVDRTEHLEFPLRALESVRDLRTHLSDVERKALRSARARGASVQDIAEALGVTRQAVYYKLSQLADASGEPTPEAEVVEIPDVEESARRDDPPMKLGPTGDGVSLLTSRESDDVRTSTPRLAAGESPA